MAPVVDMFVKNKALTPAGIQLVVGLTTLLMVIRFGLDALRHRSGSNKMKMFLISLDAVTFSMIQYSLGIMQRPSATNSYYQVWAVLLVTLRYSVKIGRPAAIAMKQTPLVDLMSSFWAANILRSQARMVLKVPGWLLWSVNSARIIHCFVSSEHANDTHRENMRLLTDYMRYEHKAGSQGGQISPDPRTMAGYRYLVLGEAKKRKKKEDDGQRQEGDQEVEATESIKRLLLALSQDDKELITVEKIWSHQVAGHGGCLCLSDLPAGSNSDVIDEELKDLCLSFALYKLLRRRFFNLSIHEANLGKTRRLVFDGILGGGDPADCGNSISERAFRVSEAEVAFLNDFFNSRHAIIFAKGFPFLRLFLSILLIAGISGMAVAIRRFSRSSMEGEMAGVRHGVIFTWILLSLLGAKEVWEITTYVFSDWTKVLLLCKYVEQPWWLRRPAARALVRVLCRCRLFKRWHGKVGQFDLFCSTSKFLVWRWRRLPFFVRLSQQVKNALIKSLKHGLRRRRLDDYLEQAFQRAVASPDLEATVKGAIRGLNDVVHVLLVWHVATSYCALHVAESKLEDFTTATTLSRYCAYLLRLVPPLVPGNSLMAKAVFGEVYREKIRILGFNHVICSNHVLDSLKRWKKHLADGKKEDSSLGRREDMNHETILEKGVNLGVKLVETTDGNPWEFLSEFWAGFVLHLAASTGAYQHKIFLSTGGELMTHLWALLSHAGYMVGAAHGEHPDLTVLQPDQVYDPNVQS